MQNIEDLVLEYKKEYGEDKWKQKGFVQEYYHINEVVGIVSINDIKEEHSDLNNIEQLISELKELDQTLSIEIDGYLYRKNMILIKKGWFKHLIEDIRDCA